MDPILFTPEELSLIADEKFFRAKTLIMKKVRAGRIAEIGRATMQDFLPIITS